MAFGCSQPPKDCSHFKTGTFKYANPSYANFIVVRDDSIQIETDTVNNAKIIGSIEWIDNCKYILTYKEAINLPQNNLMGKQIEVKIVEADNKGYKCRASDGLKDLDIEMVKVD